jgi:putative protease
VDHGADSVYLGLKDSTNARNFARLNFDQRALRDNIHYARAKQMQILLALTTYPQPDTLSRWHRALDAATTGGRRHPR